MIMEKKKMTKEEIIAIFQRVEGCEYEVESDGKKYTFESFAPTL